MLPSGKVGQELPPKHPRVRRAPAEPFVAVDQTLQCLFGRYLCWLHSSCDRRLRRNAIAAAST